MTRPQLPERLRRDEFGGLWARCWKAMARQGPAGWQPVTIRIPLDDDEQRRAVAGLLGRPVRTGTASVSIALAELDEVLRRAADGWSLVSVVEAVGGPLPDRAGTSRAQHAAITTATAEVRRVAGDAGWVEPWLAALERGMLTRLHGRGELDLLVVAARLLARLPADGLPLPALASAATGDTKALSGTPLEGLVLRGLAVRLGERRPRSAAERRALWEAVGVVPDDLASQVLVLGLPVVGPGALGRWLGEATTEGLPFRVTLQQLVRSSLQLDRARPVFVCENPSVLRGAAGHLGAASAPLVCTEGRPSVACQRLLTTLRAGGCELHYHGDFDWPGLRIAASVLDGHDASPWRMHAGDYLAAVRRPGAARFPLDGAAATSPWDPGLAGAMARHGVVVYEEDVLDDLLADLATESR